MNRLNNFYKGILGLTIIPLFTTFITPISFGQTCAPDVLNGQNLVTNPDFSQAYTGWTYTADPTRTNGYAQFILGTTPNSSPGYIYAGSSPDAFNHDGFNDYSDHTPSPNNDNMMLMVDGICQVGVKLWQQTNIPVKAGESYYFSLWISSLKDNPTDQGELRFDVDGVDMGTAIVAPVTGGTWIKFEQIWTNVGATRNITISIENTTTTGCASEVDFAIDDISFIPGCQYGSGGYQPNLGADRSICGQGGSITLDAGIPVANRNAADEIRWNGGPVLLGSNPANYQLTVSAAGTYYVCVKQPSGCTKTDVVVISNTFTIDLGPNVTLCSPASATLDPGYSGSAVTYQWYRESNGTAGWQAGDTLIDGKTNTYLINMPGVYRVAVTSPPCGTQTDEITITTNAATPTNGTYCTNNSTVNLSVAGSGTYRWYNTQAKGTGTLLGSGLTYTTGPLTAPNDYTYYVEDIASFTGQAGQSTLIASGLSNWGINAGGLHQEINISKDLTITSLKIPIQNISNSSGTITLEVRDAAGASFSPAKTFTSDVTNITTAQEGQLVQFNFTGFNLQLAWGANLRLVATAKTFNGNISWNQNPSPAPTYPSPASGALRVMGASGSNAQDDDYVHFYDIRYQAGTPCDRVPVTVTHICPLPVELIYFNTELVSGKVYLEWSTAKEENNSYFHVERSSDGIHFEAMTRVNGHGNSNSNLTYFATDPNPVNGIGYYRLAQVDLDGTVHYGPINSVRNSNYFVTVSPNPNHGNFNLSFTCDSEAEVKLSLLNPLGKMVYEETVTTTSENFSKDLTMQHLSSGVYYLHMEGLDQKSITKIVIE